jgi:hypothetical protein
MKLKNEVAKDAGDKSRNQLDAYDLFRLNLILNPNGYEASGYYGRGVE